MEEIKVGVLANSTASVGKSVTYGDEWNILLARIAGCDGDLTKLMSVGSSQCNKFRSVWWRVFLRSLPLKSDSWEEAVLVSRKFYATLLSQYQLDPRVCGVEAPNLAQFNPLSLEENSPWQQWFHDKELKACIEQDVERTFPELEYFHSTDVRDVMIQILFVYARLHPKVGYKQGMHEILAPVLFVLFFDQQSFAHAEEIAEFRDNNVRQLETLRTLMDPVFLAADAYELFTRVMSVIHSWYSYSEISSPESSNNKPSGIISPVPFARPQDHGPSSALVRKLNFISDKLVKEIDPLLHKHLEDLEIAPQIYGIRWLRLLFGREFPIHDLLFVWDAIFHDGDPFMLVDYIYVAMLEVLRDVLLSCDYSECLCLLMKYPQVSDVQTILKLAYHYQDPGKYPIPANTRNLILNPSFQPTRRTSMMNVKAVANGLTTVDTVNRTIVQKTEVSVHSTGLPKSPSFSRLLSLPRRSVPKESAKFYTTSYPEVGNVDYSQKKNPTKNWAPNGKGPMTLVPCDVLELMKEQIGTIQGRLNDVESTSFKVADRINKHTEFLSQRFAELGLTTDDPAYQSIVELKQMAHTLRGLLPDPFEHSPIVAVINTPVEIGTDASSQSELTEETSPTPHKRTASVSRHPLSFPEELGQFVAVAQENEMKEIRHACQ